MPLQLSDRLRPERTGPPLVAFSVQPDTERGEVEIADAEIGDFLDTCAGVVEEQEQEAIAHRVTTARGQPLKHCLDIGAFQKACLRWVHALDGNPRHLLTDRQTLGGAPSEILEEADEHGTPMIPSPNVIVPLKLQEVQKALCALHGEVVQPHAGDGATAVIGDEREEQPKSIAVSADRARPQTFLRAEVIEEEAVDVRPQIAWVMAYLPRCSTPRIGRSGRSRRPAMRA